VTKSEMTMVSHDSCSKCPDLQQRSLNALPVPLPLRPSLGRSGVTGFMHGWSLQWSVQLRSVTVCWTAW